MNILLAVKADQTLGLKFLRDLGFTNCKLLFNRDNSVTFRYNAVDKLKVKSKLGSQDKASTADRIVYKYQDLGFIVIEPMINRITIVNKENKPQAPAKPAFTPPSKPAPIAPPVVHIPPPVPKPEDHDGGKMADDANVPVTHVPSALQKKYEACKNSQFEQYRLQFLKEVWAYFNEAKFSNKLRLPSIILKKNTAAHSTRTLAYWNSGKRVIAIHPRLFNKSRDSFMETFLHEMCHEAVSELEPPGTSRAEGPQGHGPTWKKWMTKVGLNPRRFNPDSRDELLDEGEKAAKNSKMERFNSLKSPDNIYRGLGVAYVEPDGSMVNGLVIGRTIKKGNVYYVIVNLADRAAALRVKTAIKLSPLPQETFSSATWNERYLAWKSTLVSRKWQLPDKEGTYAFVCNAHLRLAQSIPDVTLTDATGEAVLRTRLPKLPSFESLGVKGGIELRLYVEPTKEFYALYSLDESRFIGYLSYITNCSHMPKMKGYVQASYLTKKWRGKGLGIVLYLGLLHNRKHVCSDANFSASAVRTWRALSKYNYKVKLWCTTFDKPTSFEFIDNIPYVEGKSIERLREEFVMYV